MAQDVSNFLEALDEINGEHGMQGQTQHLATQVSTERFVTAKAKYWRDDFLNRLSHG